ncbi:MAG TPA: hypothetical protein VGD91_14495 [Trebonia sp.]
MRRQVSLAAFAALIAVLAGTACSGTPASSAAGSATAAPARSATATAAPARSAAGAAAAAPGFTVAGVRPVPPNGSQDTGARAAGASCDAGQLAADRRLGDQIAAGFSVAGLPASAGLLRHFLAGSGTGVSYRAGSLISRLAAASTAFLAVNADVQSAVIRQLKAGRTRVRLSAAQLPTVAFDSAGGELYWGFRGTQGLSVTGSGHRENSRYSGTLSYVIRDSYGFPAGDTLGGFGAPMRYLQTACGAPGHAGAHWFPDAITVTVPFTAAV